MTFHDVQPVVGTTFRAADGRPADLMVNADYPVIAVCMGCSGPILLQRFHSPCWEHLQATVTQGALPPR